MTTRHIVGLTTIDLMNCFPTGILRISSNEMRNMFTLKSLSVSESEHNGHSLIFTHPQEHLARDKVICVTVIDIHLHLPLTVHIAHELYSHNLDDWSVKKRNTVRKVTEATGPSK